MSEPPPIPPPQPSPPSPVADPVRPLDYAPPLRRARLSKLIGGLIISAFYAFSGGMIAFGIMLWLQRDRDAPGFVATGVASAILATGMLITVLLARR